MAQPAAKSCRTWLDEGRVSEDSLVWREGWPDWQAAGAVFPDLQLPAVSTPAARPAPTPAVTPVAVHVPASRARKRPRLRTKDAVILLLLMLAVVILTVTFFAVLLHPGV